MKITLAAARVNAGLKQTQVCKALKMSKTTLSNYETGLTKPDIDRAKELVSLYGCELDDIKWGNK